MENGERRMENGEWRMENQAINFYKINFILKYLVLGDFMWSGTR